MVLNFLMSCITTCKQQCRMFFTAGKFKAYRSLDLSHSKRTYHELLLLSSSLGGDRKLVVLFVDKLNGEKRRVSFVTQDDVDAQN